MVLSIMVPHFPAIGSGGVPPVPPTILMSEFSRIVWSGLVNKFPWSFMVPSIDSLIKVQLCIAQ